MRNYFAPRRCVSCDWNNLPNVTYIVSPIEIEKRVILYDSNTPKEVYYIVKFPQKKQDGVDFCEKTRINKIYTSEQECQNRCHTLNLAVKNYTKNVQEEFENSL